MKYIYGFKRILIIAIVLIQACWEKEVKRLPTASKEVTILHNKFLIDGLNRERTVRIYLPPGYSNTNQKYPVLYMHDGQNLFDDSTSYVGEWKVDETLNQLSISHNLNLIVVGIDHGNDKRHLELSPWNNDQYGVGEGKLYVDFIVNKLKPYIDNKYRTKSEQKNTAIMGSSMGGLISHYAIFKHSEVFSKAGIFSPAYWYAEKEVFGFTQQSNDSDNSALKLYLLVGSEEGDKYIKLFNRMEKKLNSKGFSSNNLITKITDDAEHNETFWSSEFRQAILWLFSEVGNDEN